MAEDCRTRTLGLLKCFIERVDLSIPWYMYSKFLNCSVTLSTLYFCFVISCSVFVCTVVPVSANGLGISHGFTKFQLNGVFIESAGVERVQWLSDCPWQTEQRCDSEVGGHPRGSGLHHHSLQHRSLTAYSWLSSSQK